MLKLGFATRWVDLIMLCVSSISYYVMVNDHLVGPIKPKRGLRQRDPYHDISSLFVLNVYLCLSDELFLVVFFMELKFVKELQSFHIYFLQMIVSYFFKLPLMNVELWNIFFWHMRRLLCRLLEWHVANCTMSSLLLSCIFLDIC